MKASELVTGQPPWISLISAIFCGIYVSAASANAPLPSADPRGVAADEQIQHTQRDSLEPLQKALEEQSETPQINADEAADTLAKESEVLNSGVLSKLPSLDNLAALEARMRAEPKNLDHYFAHAQMANELGEYEAAAQTYEAMLALAPSLDRIRLELGSAYLRLGRFEQAREQLRQVLAKDLPPQVRANVEQVMAQVKAELNEHDVSGLVSIGVNWDRNANSAPRSESVVIQDIIIPLSGEQLAQRDMQFFASTGINHTYRPRWAQDDAFARRWKSSANLYRAKQSSQEGLNVEVRSIRTGPEFQSKTSGIKLHPSLGYSEIRLAGHTYLRSSSGDVRFDVPIDEALQLSATARYESRDFVNSPSVSVFELREGTASQFGVSGQYVLSQNDIFNASFTQRREHTQEAFFDNSQYNSSFGYTRILKDGMFVSSTLGARFTHYEASDPLISAKRRHDSEYSAGLTLGKQLSDSITATLGYQYRTNRSNIRNFAYDNHRLSASIAKRF